jgi:hypothetical protein
LWIEPVTIRKKSRDALRFPPPPFPITTPMRLSERAITGVI